MEVEIFVRLGVPCVFRFQLDRAPEVPDCGVCVPEERIEAGEVIEQARDCPDTPADPARSSLVRIRSRPSARRGSPRRPIPRPRPRTAVPAQPPTTIAVVSRLGCHGPPANCGVPDEDDGAGRRIELVSGDGEARRAGEDDVELLVPAGSGSKLVVVLDQLVSWRRGPVGVDPERGDAERSSQRLPLSARGTVRHSLDREARRE